MANPILDWLAQNFLLIYFFFMNIVFIFVLIRLRSVLGPFLNQSIKVAFGRMKDPNLFVHFLNSKTCILEWRAYNQVVKLDPDDSTSELVYVERGKGFTPVTPHPVAQKGFFNLGIFGSASKKERMNEIYTDEFVPVSLNATKNYWVFGRQMHVIYEGQNITQNPLELFTQDAQVKKAGIAVEHQLIANKLLAESEFRNKIATKDDVKLYGLMNLIILGLGVVALIVMVIGLQGTIGEFTKFATETFETYKPAIEAFLNNIPRVIPG